MVWVGELRASKEARQLGSVRAVIAYGPTSWPEVDFLTSQEVAEREGAEAEAEGVGVVGERFARVANHIHWTDSLPDADAYPPRFWRELLEDWSEVFRNPRNEGGIGNFYERYGPVTAFGVEKWYESLEAARLAIEWLDGMANFVRWLKNETYGPLWDWFQTPIEKRDGTDYFAACIPGSEGSERLAISFMASIVRGEVRYVHPRNEEELASSAWNAVMHAAWDRLVTIRLAPVFSDFSKRKDPTILWGFEAHGALNAAFLQFFFEELAHVHLKKCYADDCTNLLPPNRRKWCSPTCRERVKKQNWRKDQRNNLRK